MEKIETVPSMRDHAAKLGIPVPEAAWILPRGFFGLAGASDVLYDRDYELVVKLFRRNGIPYSLIDGNTEQYEKLANNSFGLAEIPLIAFTLDFLTKNPTIISETLDLIRNFLAKRSRLQPDADSNSVKISVIKERRHDTRRYDYEGRLEGIPKFSQLIQEDCDG